LGKRRLRRKKERKKEKTKQRDHDKAGKEDAETMKSMRIAPQTRNAEVVGLSVGRGVEWNNNVYVYQEQQKT